MLHLHANWNVLIFHLAAAPDHQVLCTVYDAPVQAREKGLYDRRLAHLISNPLFHHRCLELLWNVESHGGIHGKNNEKIALF